MTLIVKMKSSDETPQIEVPQATKRFQPISEDEEFNSQSFSPACSTSLTSSPQGIFKRLRLDSVSSISLSCSPTSSSLQEQHLLNPVRRRSRSVSFSFSKVLPEIGEDSVSSDSVKLKRKNNIGETSLMMAAREGSISKTKKLLENGADANVVDKRGFDALMYAVRDGHCEVASLLVSHCKSFSKRRTKYGLTHILYASLNGHRDIVQMLYKNSDDGAQMLNAADEYGFSPLMGAARNGHVDTAKTLIDLGASLEQKDKNGLTALFWAVISKNTDVIALLGSKGADMNTRERKNKSPLLWAVVKGETEIAQQLLGLGAKVCDAVRLYCLMDHIKKNKAQKELTKETAKIKMVSSSNV